MLPPIEASLILQLYKCYTKVDGTKCYYTILNQPNMKAIYCDNQQPTTRLKLNLQMLHTVL